MRSGKNSLVAVTLIVLCLVLLFASCSRWRKGGTPGPASKDVQSASLEGQKWYLAELNGKEVKMPGGTGQPFIVLNAAKKEAGGFNGCNSFSGRYELKGSLLVFRSMGSTKMACQGPEGQIEMGFMETLRLTRTFEIAGGSLTLSDERKPLARFTMEGKGQK